LLEVLNGLRPNMSIVPGAVLMRISTSYARRGEVWRLFTELQEKNRALTQAHTQVTEALEQQTATSEILRVISRSTARARAAPSGQRSTFRALKRPGREALSTAAPLPDGVWVVDCTDEVSRDIEDWFAMAAVVESATPKGAAGRFEMLKSAVRAIQDGRAKIRHEEK